MSPHLAGQAWLAVGPVTLEFSDNALDHFGCLVLAELGAGVDARHSHPNADRASGAYAADAENESDSGFHSLQSWLDDYYRQTRILIEAAGGEVTEYLGDGVVAGVLLAKSKANNSGWVVITFAWAFVVFAAAAFAQLVVGYLVDRHSARTIFLLVAGLQAPLFAIAIAVLFLGEHMTAARWIGAAAVLMGIAITRRAAS